MWIRVFAPKSIFFYVVPVLLMNICFQTLALFGLPYDGEFMSYAISGMYLACVGHESLKVYRGQPW